MTRWTTLASALTGTALAAGLALGVGAPAGAAPAPAAPTPTASAAPTAGATPTASATATSRPSATPTARTSATPVPSPSTSTPTVTPTPVVPLPSATALDRTRGRTKNARTVVLTGANLTNLAAVRLGTRPLGPLTHLSPTRVSFVIPAAIDYQAATLAIALTAASDHVVRPSRVTFTYVVKTHLDRQMAYAFQHWNDTSSARFGYLSGNDCADFASQTLLARGWKQSSAWYDHGPGDWSGTWVSSTALSTWLKSRHDLVQRLTWSGRDAVQVGDIVQFRWTGHPKGYAYWDHTAIVSKVVVQPDGHHDLYYVAHTNNRQYGGGTTELKGATTAIQFFHVIP